MRLRSCGTHSGTFHADEVAACALLVIFDQIDQDKIVRTRDLALLAEMEYVCDVGGLYNPEKKRFDHHQLDYQGSLSSAGMVLKYLKDFEIIEEELFHFLNRSLIMGIDAIDNGQVTPVVGHCSFSGVIANFVPVKYDPDPSLLEQSFYEALTFVKGHLERLVERFLYIRECRYDVERAMREGTELLVFDRSIPWMESFFELGGDGHPALFLVMPTGENWKLRGIPPSIRERMSVRHPLPKEWAGLLDDELEKVSKIKGAIFCHKGRFISVWRTKEAALKAFEETMKR